MEVLDKFVVDHGGRGPVVEWPKATKPPPYNRSHSRTRDQPLKKKKQAVLPKRPKLTSVQTVLEADLCYPDVNAFQPSSCRGGGGLWLQPYLPYHGLHHQQFVS